MKIVITGKSGSGKNYLLTMLMKKYKYLPKFTTRPKRTGEKDGYDYDFITRDKMKRMDIKYVQSFKIKPTGWKRFFTFDTVWYYGMSVYNYENTDILIMTPYELSLVDTSNFFIIYLDIDRETRKNRIAARNDSSDSIERRLSSDDKDFENFDNYDVVITNSNYSIEDIENIMP